MAGCGKGGWDTGDQVLDLFSGSGSVVQQGFKLTAPYGRVLVFTF